MKPIGGRHFPIIENMQKVKQCHLGDRPQPVHSTGRTSFSETPGQLPVYTVYPIKQSPLGDSAPACYAATHKRGDITTDANTSNHSEKMSRSALALTPEACMSNGHVRACTCRPLLSTRQNSITLTIVNTVNAYIYA
jgi:hypothetical protein